MRPTRVLLVDDTSDVRSLLKLSLGAEDGVEVVAEASNGIEAIVLADNHRPDVVVLDLSMPLMDGVEALPLIRRTAPETRVLVLSSLEARSTAAQVLERGAHAYLEKGEAVERISEGIRELAGGLNGGRQGGASTFQDSAERFREIFDHVELPVLILDDEARVLRVNRALGIVIGLDESELAGRALSELVHPDDLERVQRIVNRIFHRHRQQATVEARLLRQSGAGMWARLTASPIDGHDEPASALVVLEMLDPA